LDTISICVLDNVGVRPIEFRQFTQQFQDLYKLHRTIFWSSKGEKILAFFEGVYDLYVRNKNDLYGCAVWIKELNFWCDHEAIYLITLASVHNVSFLLKDFLKNRAYSQMFINSNELIQEPHIITINFYADYNGIDPSRLTEFKFNFLESIGFHYCIETKASKSTFKFKFWIAGFPAHVWLIAVFVPAVCRLISLAYKYTASKCKTPIKFFFRNNQLFLKRCSAPSLSACI